MLDLDVWLNLKTRHMSVSPQKGFLFLNFTVTLLSYFGKLVHTV